MGVRRRPAAAVLTAALLLAGCGAAGHPGRGPDAAAAPPGLSGSAGGAAPTGPADPDAGATEGAEAPGSAADAPKVPDARLTPSGGGTFSPRQKAYLSGRVPSGTDPAAVLEGGQELCERLTRTAAVDPDAAAGAIVTGDISLPGATAAVRSLCPERQPVVDAAGRGFADGTHPVAARPVAGRSVAPGTYRAPHPSAACAWRITRADGTTLSSGSAATAAPARLTVPAAARGVTSSGCYAWLAHSGGTR